MGSEAPLVDANLVALLATHTRATELEPASAETWLTLGAACDALGDHRAALAAYTECATNARGVGTRECRALVR